MAMDKKSNFTATRNACKLCTPLGASYAFRGIADTVLILHGSQGCSTYIRRYMISHFKEPLDIASTNFSEETAVFGGKANLKLALDNIRIQYRPRLIGIATTCLSETIGDDVSGFIKEYKEERKDEELPEIVSVSTASYRGTHIDGFHATVKSIAAALAEGGEKENLFNLMPGMLSPADLRHFMEIMEDFELPSVLLPDFSESLDGQLWSEYQQIPPGGTDIDEIRRMGRATASIELGRILSKTDSAGKYLEKEFSVPLHSPGIPIGVKESDRFFDTLEELSGRETPKKYESERNRLIDSYADGHKYVFGARCAVYGEEDLVVALTSFLAEIGVVPAMIVSGGKSGLMKEKLLEVYPDLDEEKTTILSGADFLDMEDRLIEMDINFLLGNSKGFKTAKKLDVPLVRVGFPVHDRFGGQRILTTGYRGTQMLFDRIVNAIIERRQAENPVGYTYM